MGFDSRQQQNKLWFFTPTAIDIKKNFWFYARQPSTSKKTSDLLFDSRQQENKISKSMISAVDAKKTFRI